MDEGALGWLESNGAAQFAKIVRKVPSLLTMSMKSLIILAPNDAAMERLQVKIGHPLIEIVEIPKVLEVFLNHFAIHPWQSTYPLFRSVTGFGFGSEAPDFKTLGVQHKTKIDQTDLAVISVVMVTAEQLADVTASDGLVNHLESLPYHIFLNIIEAGQIKGKDLVRLCSTSANLKEKCERPFEQTSEQGRVLETIPQLVYSRLLAKEFGITQPLPGKTVRETYVWYSRGGHLCQSIFRKFAEWKHMKAEAEEGRLEYPATIYDMLYETHHDGYTIGSWLLEDETTHYNWDQLSRYEQSKVYESLYPKKPWTLSQRYFFQTIFEDMENPERYVPEMPGYIEDYTPGIRYDYDLMKNEYFGIPDDARFKYAFEDATGLPVTILNTYPLLYSENLRTNPAMLDRDFLRKQIRHRTDELLHFINDNDETLPLRPELEAVRLTDPEIEFILDLHFRVLDPADPLKINSLATCEDILR